MTEEKKYRVICETEEQYRILKKIYPKIHTYVDEHYYCTWCSNSVKLSQFKDSFDHSHITPISFQEWKKDYYATNQLTNVDYDVY